MKKLVSSAVLFSTKMDTKVRLLIAIVTIVAFVLAAGAPMASGGH